MFTNGLWAEELGSHFPLSAKECAFYDENGYVKLGQVLSPPLLKDYREEITTKVAELSIGKPPLDQRTTYDKAFLQVMNLWRLSPKIRELVFSKRLARIATELMNCKGVRIYHDQALYKEPGGGKTPWHADQYYFPVSNNNVVTAWIPLQDTPIEMGPLAFSEKSHRLHQGRDLAISDESELTLARVLQEFSQNNSPYAFGDVSFHAGWTFHRAGPNTTQAARQVMTVIYIDQDIRLATPRNKNQVADMETWCPSVRIGDIIASPINPVIYTRDETGARAAS